LDFDIEKDIFWVVNTNLKSIEPFKSFYNKDKSKKKDKSSRIMWAIHMYSHPTSDMYNDPNKGERLAADYLKDKEFIWDDYSEITDSYVKLALLPAQQELHDWNELMRKRKKLLTGMYDEEISKDSDERNMGKIVELDKLLGATAKMFSDYIKIKKEFDEEELQQGDSKTVFADY
jgi:hypothetical protein